MTIESKFNKEDKVLMIYNGEIKTFEVIDVLLHHEQNKTQIAYCLKTEEFKLNSIPEAFLISVNGELEYALQEYGFFN